ncbi:inositol monophosphatase family protein [Actinokineospora fastidiosa]|uniref:3'(2'),5'-bisphosphate nucleotidase CysQ n=1 Tax=Actinokineospora fastidiosa TaxID=1816 RepID=A0A918G799_9PSEU|nr:inositol monophosphatase family protein [Actinokineospora fastidiosa]GGS21071.1 3'(2'),5'-bisphosphate nucleotidase CysQ [Actinokineospora fastidiosa]
MDDAAVAEAAAGRAAALLTALRADNPPDVGALADAEANAAILGMLADLRPRDAVLSEESPDDPARPQADRVWIIDPLDGTREYAAGVPEWAVHVALWERGAGITAAAVALPDRVHVRGDLAVPPTRSDLRIVISASRPPDGVADLAERVGARLVPMGSAGVKTMAVLRGDADAYFHTGGQWEWDSAAPVGVAVAAGLHASRVDGSPLRYNQPRPYLPDLLVCRPELADRLLTAWARRAG